MAYYTPVLHVVEGMRNSRLGWPAALSELIDNSFDAGAMQVSIEFAGKTVTVTDDGGGAPDVLSMVVFGSHKRHRSTSLGQYGIGLKDAWLWCGDTIDIRTTREGATTSIRVKYPADLNEVEGRWVGPDPVTVAAGSQDKGTRIRFEGIRRTPPADELLRNLGRTFMPALESGRQIVVSIRGARRPVQPYKLPQKYDTVIDTFEVEGRQTSIDIGIIKDGERIEEPGFLLCYGHRVIRTCILGTGDYSAGRLTGKVVLGPGWKLTKNKDDLSDFHDQLDEAIYSRISWLCQKAEQLAEDIESSALRAEIESLINSAVSETKGKERRGGSSGQTGTVEPVASGRKRRRAEKVHLVEGDVIGRESGSRRRGVKLHWYSADESVIGKYDATSGSVCLNDNNQYIAKVKKTGNREALYAVAMGLLAYGHCTHEQGGRQKLLMPVGEFVPNWGRLMNSIRFPQGKEVRDAV